MERWDGEKRREERENFSTGEGGKGGIRGEITVGRRENRRENRQPGRNYHQAWAGE